MAVTPSLSENDLDAYRSEALHTELPGLAGVFDTAAMGEVIQTALIGGKSGDFAVEECELDQATYLAGEDCEARYLLTMREKATGTMLRNRAVARVFPGAEACSDYLEKKLLPLVPSLEGRQEVRGFERLAAAGPGNSTVCIFPLDGELPTLAAATDPERICGLLNDLPEWGSSIDGCQVELVDYARRHRCVLRYHLLQEERRSGVAAPGSTVVYGKVFPDDRGAYAGVVIDALRERAAAASSPISFRVPRSLGWLSELNLLLLEAIPGEAVVPDLIKSRPAGVSADAIPNSETISLEEAIRSCAQVAAALHTANVGPGEIRAFEDEVLQLRYELSHVRRLSPDLGALLASWLGELELRAAKSKPLNLCFSHGDYTPGQLLFDGTNCGLVDFDSVCRAEPALDLGQFMAYLRIGGAKAKDGGARQRPAPDEMAARFLDAYVTASDRRWNEDQLRSRVAIYTAISLLRRALRSWEKFKPKRVASAVALLGEELWQRS